MVDLDAADTVIQPMKEGTKVVGVVDGLLLIRRERVWADGAVLGGAFMCEPHVAGWLADQLELAAEEQVSETANDAPPDHVVVFLRGGEHGAPINIHVHNDREASAPHGKTYTLSAMSPAVARKLASDIRACLAAPRH